MIYALFLYIKTFYSFQRKTTISATAATPWGEYWLKKLGFSLYKEGAFRNDGHDYYIKDVTLKDLRKWEKDFEKISHKIDCSAYSNFINSEDGQRVFKNCEASDRHD